MPKFQVLIQAYLEQRVIEAPTQAAAEKIARNIVEGGYDKRYWGFEIYAYSVNGEDF
jgi:hypothetical protein